MSSRWRSRASRLEVHSARYGAIQSSMAIELAEHASRAGADAVSSIPPFAGGYSWAEVRSFYTELAGASRYGALPPLALKPITFAPWTHIWV